MESKRKTYALGIEGGDLLEGLTAEQVVRAFCKTTNVQLIQKNDRISFFYPVGRGRVFLFQNIETFEKFAEEKAMPEFTQKGQEQIRGFKVKAATDAIRSVLALDHLDTFGYDCSVNPEGLSQKYISRQLEGAEERMMIALARLTDKEIDVVLKRNQAKELDGSTYMRTSVKEIRENEAKRTQIKTRPLAGLKQAEDRINNRINKQNAAQEVWDDVFLLAAKGSALTLSERGKIFAVFRKAMNGTDWHYDYSDDPEARRRGYDGVQAMNNKLEILATMQPALVSLLKGNTERPLAGLASKEISILFAKKYPYLSEENVFLRQRRWEIRTLLTNKRWEYEERMATNGGVRKVKEVGAIVTKRVLNAVLKFARFVHILPIKKAQGLKINYVSQSRIDEAKGEREGREDSFEAKPMLPAKPINRTNQTLGI